MKKLILQIFVVGLIIAGIIYLESKKPDRENDVVEIIDESLQPEKSERYETVKEITTPDGFINSSEFTLADYVGKKVILVDFWTYSCINCQRTTPYLNDWYKKYEDDGLIIVGIHTPEFEFEKDYKNVERAVEKFGIDFPVVLDNDFSTWRAYQNRYWPRKYLIDIDGYIVYDHIGEGAYKETEEAIVKALNERNERLGLENISIKDSLVDAENPNFSEVETRETYLGYSRMSYNNNSLDEISSCPEFKRRCNFTKPEILEANHFAFAGLWNIDEEYSEVLEEDSSIFIDFKASKVNLVIESEDDHLAEVYLDGELISEDKSGYSVENGVVMFNDAGLYNLVDLNGEYGRHVLEIRFKDAGVRAFAFTFG